MGNQEPTLAPVQPIFDQKRPPELKLKLPPNLPMLKLWESKSWTYTGSIPRTLVPYHSVEEPGEYLVTVTLVAAADSFEPYGYTVNDQELEVTQTISSQATYLNMEDMVNGCLVELFEEDAHKQLTFASVTLTRCTNKKYQDALIPKLDVWFSKDYFKAEGLCEDEQKRRRKEVRDFFHSDKNPIVRYGIDGISWDCLCGDALQYHGNVPTSALEKFSEWVMRNHIYRKYVRVEFPYDLWDLYHTRYVDEK